MSKNKIATMTIHNRKEIYMVSIVSGDEHFRKYDMDNRSYSRVNGVWKYNTGGSPLDWTDINKEQSKLLEEEFEVLQTRFVMIEKLINVAAKLFPTAIEIDTEAESRYPVKTHNYPNDSPYIQSKASFLYGINWLKQYIQTKR